MAKYLLKLFTIWSIGALTYGSIELLSRGYTHISMGVVGGICLLSIDYLNQKFGSEVTVILKMFFSAIIITVLEFFTGVIVNIWLNLNVWDYSDVPLDLCGQICIPFFGIWFILSFFGIILENFIHWKIFCEERPQLKLLKRIV